MTYEEALEVFGLSRIQSIETMKVLRNAAAKQAHLANDTQRLIVINAAWAILSGKEEAELAEERHTAKHDGLSGIVKAKCGEKTDKEFVLDWVMIPYGADDNADLVQLTNPQRLEWDTNFNGFVRIDVSGQRKPYYMQGLRYTTGRGPIDGYSEIWPSDFCAEVEFKKVRCPVCRAPHLQWCQDCHTIFCHRNKEDYPSGKYKCPACSSSFSWGGTGASIKTRFDGKQIRSLTDESPVSLPKQSDLKLLKNR